METLKFRLSGESAFFKKPEFNEGLYFTYNHIHKVALLGLLGAVLGYDGYQQRKGDEFPEFYNKLQSLKIAIVPIQYDKVVKKFQTFNNSVGYASLEEGGNLIVTQQWLYNVQWDIYILLDNDESYKIKDAFLNNRSFYIPYLGTNDHFANISDIEVLSIEVGEDASTISSLCKAKDILFDVEDMGDYDIFMYQENMPIALNDDTQYYELETIVYSNLTVKQVLNGDVYKINNIYAQFI